MRFSNPTSAGAPHAAPAQACTPGADGIPDGPVGRILCGDWHTDLGQTLADHWLLWTVAVAALVLLRIGWAWLARRRWRQHAARARWLEIIPPVTATPGSTVQLWRLLATLLAAPRWWQHRPARLVWEVVATADQLRCGLWVLPGINPIAVTRVVQRGWPGARLTHRHPPRLPAGGSVAAHRLILTQDEWLPLLDDPPEPGAHRRGDTGPAPVEADRLRAVYDGLAAAGRTSFGLLQVHIARAPRSRVAVLRKATADPRRARRRGRSVAARLLDGIVVAVRAGLDLILGGPPTRHRGTGLRSADPYAARLAALAREKHGDPPHLLAAVHAAAVGPTRAAARAACEDITSGYGLLSAQLSHRRLHRARTVVNTRWAPTSRMTLASVSEAAALAGLPAEPSTHGLPAAAARARTPSHHIWSPTRTAEGETP